jgi:hypothetical protein
VQRYSAAYSQLHNAARAEVDPCAEVKDAKVGLYTWCLEFRDYC